MWRGTFPSGSSISYVLVHLILSQARSKHILSRRPTRVSCFLIPSKNMLSSLRLPDRSRGLLSFLQLASVDANLCYRYALRRRELLAKGVDPANLSVFGAAFTKGLSTSERVTNAGVAVRLQVARPCRLTDSLQTALQGTIFIHSKTDGEQVGGGGAHPLGIAYFNR
jgi:hypothetical protein